jgi:hypothetical protein
LNRIEKEQNSTSSNPNVQDKQAKSMNSIAHVTTSKQAFLPTCRGNFAKANGLETI